MTALRPLRLAVSPATSPVHRVHAERATYQAWIDEHCASSAVRWARITDYDRFVERWASLQDWFDAPLRQRIDCVRGQHPHGGASVIMPYLTYLSLRSVTRSRCHAPARQSGRAAAFHTVGPGAERGAAARGCRGDGSAARRPRRLARPACGLAPSTGWLRCSSSQAAAPSLGAATHAEWSSCDSTTNSRCTRSSSRHPLPGSITRWAVTLDCSPGCTAGMRTDSLTEPPPVPSDQPFAPQHVGNHTDCGRCRTAHHLDADGNCIAGE